MKKNGVRELWSNGKGVVNSWLAIPNSFSAEIVASLGFDSVTVDMQHGMVDFQRAVEMLQAISLFDATPLVRVPWNDPAIIMKSLDLHGVKHRDVEELVDSFIGRYFHVLPIEIITGNSADMQKMVKEIVKSYKIFSA